MLAEQNQMAISEAELFRKQVVHRPPATSILSSLLSSPQTTCSSPDLASPSDCFSECDLTSRTDSPSPPARTPPRRSCLSFAAAPPRSPPPTIKTQVSKSEEGFVRSHFPRPQRSTESNPVNIDVTVVDKEDASIRPVGSVFDEFGEDRSSPVFHDYYRVGQPKKLVDDCLRKEKELRILAVQEDEERDYGEEYPVYASDEGEDEDEDGDYDDEDDSDEGSPTKSVDNTRSSTKEADFSTPVRLRINIPVTNGGLLSPAIYTPSRDVIDNFVPGTLDEDHIEAFLGRSPRSPHDIDPTYPSEGEEDGDQQSQQARILNSPVRFIPSTKPSIPRRPANMCCQLPASGLNRTHSLPWGYRRFNSHLKPSVTKRAFLDQPRCSAIAITKSIQRKRHHWKEKRDIDQSNEMKGVGAVAMAAMARQLTSNHTLVGIWALSV
jgi:hypothetical protein